jgi:hypothetical protein
MSKTTPERPDPLQDIHSPEFWARDTANVNAVFARFQVMRPEEATIDDLRQFAAETIRLLIHTRQILRQTCLEYQPTPPKPARKPRTRKPKIAHTADPPFQPGERLVSKDGQGLAAILAEAVAPEKQEATRQALLAWAAHSAVDQCVEARVDEIARFAEAGKTQEMYSVEQIQGYFMGRMVSLLIQRAEGTSDE